MPCSRLPGFSRILSFLWTLLLLSYSGPFSKPLELRGTPKELLQVLCEKEPHGPSKPSLGPGLLCSHILSGSVYVSPLAPAEWMSWTGRDRTLALAQKAPATPLSSFPSDLSPSLTTQRKYLNLLYRWGTQGNSPRLPLIFQMYSSYPISFSSSLKR